MGMSSDSTLRLVTDSGSSIDSFSKSIDSKKFINELQNEPDPRFSSYRRQHCMQEKYGSKKIRKKQDIDQTPFSNSKSKSESLIIVDVNIVSENRVKIHGIGIKQPHIEVERRKGGQSCKINSYNTKENRETVKVYENTTFKSLTDKILSAASSSENVGDESLNTMVNTPLAFESGTKVVSALIKPLKKEIYRNQIMPSKIETSTVEYITPHKSKYGHTNKK